MRLVGQETSQHARSSPPAELLTFQCECGQIITTMTYHECPMLEMTSQQFYTNADRYRLMADQTTDPTRKLLYRQMERS